MNKHSTIRELLIKTDIEMTNKCESNCNECKWNEKIKNGMNLKRDSICDASSIIHVMFEKEEV